MNPLESFEKQLKESADMQIDHSASFIWEDLSKAIQPKKKKRRIFFYFFLGSALLISSVILFMTNDGIVNRESVFIPNSSVRSDKTNASEAVSADPSIGNSEPNSGTSNSVVKIENQSDKTKVPVVISKSNGSATEEFKSNRRALNTHRNNSFESFQNDNKSTVPGKLKKVNNDGPQVNINQESALTKPEEVIVNENLPSGPEEKRNFELESLQPITTLNAVPESMTDQSPDFSEPQCPTFRKKRVSFFVELEGQAGFPLKQMNSGPEASKLYELRKSSEKPWYSAGAGLHFGMLYRNKLSVSTGLDWLMVNEKFDYSKTDIVDLIYHVDPNTGNVTGPFIVTKNITNSGQIRHTLLDIPVVLGCHIKSGGWNIGIQAGPFINLNLTSRGKIMTATDQVGQLKDQNVYKNSVGAGLQGSLVVSRRLTNNLSLYLKPGFKYYLNDWTNNEYPIHSKFNNAAVSIGVRKAF